MGSVRWAERHLRVARRRRDGLPREQRRRRGDLPAARRSWSHGRATRRALDRGPLPDQFATDMSRTMQADDDLVPLAGDTWATVDVVQVEQLPVPISRGAALMLLGAVYFVTGLLASLTLDRANRICLLLKQSTDALLIEAVLIYPSIPTMKASGRRVGLSLLPPVFVVAGIVKIFGNEIFALWPIVGGAYAVSPVRFDCLRTASWVR